MEQYSRRNCLKITGIPEEKNENTDKLVLKVINNLILNENNDKITTKTFQDHTELASLTLVATRQVTLLLNSLASGRGPEFYANKKNLKSYNRNPTKQTGPIYVNEALTSRRSELY